LLHCVLFIIVFSYIAFKYFLFHLNPIDGIKFKPVKIDIYQEVIKIVDNEIFYDFRLNTTESVIVERDRNEVWDKIQRSFGHQYHLYGKLKEKISRLWIMEHYRQGGEYKDI
jgi:hypothetical protein